jgi:FtsH-binding integral membrane protein
MNAVSTPVDTIVFKVAAGVSGGASVWVHAQDASIAVVGVPLAVVLAALCGALFWLSIRPPATPRAAVTTVLMSTALGAMIEPAVQHYLDAPDKIAIALGAMCGFGVQAGALALIERIKTWGQQQ